MHSAAGFMCFMQSDGLKPGFWSTFYAIFRLGAHFLCIFNFWIDGLTVDIHGSEEGAFAVLVGRGG